MAYHRTRVGEVPENRGFPVFKTIIVLVSVFAWSFWYVRAVGSIPVGKGTYIVTKGDSVATLPKRLKISVSDWRYKAYLRFFAPKIPNLQVGTYVVEAPSTVSQVFSDTLQSPSAKDLTVTFLPGWTVYDIDAYLAGLSLTESGEISHPSDETLTTLVKKYPFLKGKASLEGFVYPDTYRVRPDADAASILSRALSNFQTKIYSKNSDLGDDFYRTLILASIVEKEERDDDNKALVAGVLQRRLEGKCQDTGRVIGADATVCYAYGITSRECTPSFIADHVTEVTAYNTRKTAGLPPTPIANPAAGSFSAARNPDESGGYCYYLHDSSGSIHFARTGAEHSRNKAQYLGR